MLPARQPSFLPLLTAAAVLTIAPVRSSAFASPQTGGSPSPSISYFDVAQDPAFNGYKRPLERLSRQHPHAGGNRFCVLGYAAGDGTKAAWVLWPQGTTIFHWTGNTSPLDSPQTIHLKTDVVATQAEVGTSTYLVTEAWVSNLKSTCAAQGKTLRA